MLQKILASLRRPTVLFLLVGIAIAIATAIFLWHRTRQATARELQAEQLRLPDTLRVVTLSGATTFFIYRDEPMGYQYELVRLFAQSHKLPVKLYVTHSMEEAEAMVEQGRVDLCITPQAMTHSAKERLRFAGPETMTGLVLVQRRAKAGDSIPYIQDVAALLGKELTVMAGSRAEERIKRLEEQLGGKILMREITADTISTEDLIAQVASREINYTIADADLAKLSKTYYPQLDISLEVGFAQRLRWFVSRKAIGLADALDKWAKDIPEDRGFHEIYKRYFELSKSDDGEEAPLLNPPKKEDIPAYGTQPAHPSPPSTTEKQLKETATHEPTPSGGYGISRFDKLFEKEARRIGWPWQVLASIAYQESNFRPEVVGWSGARGLMGIMPRTGKIYGASVKQLLDPAVSVRVAVDCLKSIDALFQKQLTDPEERIKVTLAAYNAGPAHLQDAIRLAEKYGYSSTRWEGGIETALRLKSEAKYYNDPVCRAGYLRGKGVARYVDEVISRYHGYLSRTK